MLTNIATTVALILLSSAFLVTLIALFYIQSKQKIKVTLKDKVDDFIPYTGYLKANGPDINYVGDDWTLNRQNHREIAKMAEQSGRSANYIVERMIKQYRRY
jgi:predicted HicB family RNase H-like nuclease